MAKRRVAIGKRMSSMKEMRKALKSKEGGLFAFVPKQGELTVRFLTDPEGEWVKYEEHWDGVTRTSFPCIGAATCPGCEDGMRKSERFLANALDIKSDKVIALQMAKTLAKQLEKYFTKYDTLLDRDYELTRDGEGTDTEYFAAPESKVKRNTAKYELFDLEELLEKSAASYLGDEEEDDEDDDEDEAPARSARPKKSAAAPSAKPKRKPAPVEEDEDDEDEDEEEDDEPVKKPVKKAAAKKAAAKPKPAPKRKPVVEEDEDEEEEEDEEFEDEDDSDEDEDDDDEDGDEEDDEEEDYYTESELKAMGIGQLRIIAKEYNIKTTGLKAPEIIDAILEG